MDIEAENDPENEENKKKHIPTTHYYTAKTKYYRSVESRIDSEVKKIDNITNNIRDELKKLEMEFLHLKGMMDSSNVSAALKIEVPIQSEPEVGLDDVNQINEMQCDFALNVSQEMRNNSSESESDDANILSEEDCDEITFI